MTSVAIATPAKTSDYGWNAQGVAGLKAAAKAYGIKNVKVVTEHRLQQHARGAASARRRAPLRADHRPRLAATTRRPSRSPQQYQGPDRSPTTSRPSCSPGTLSNITTSSQQGAYLAGILAAKTTKTGTIGVIISASDTNWYEMEGGYIAGARSVNPKITITTAQIGAAGYDDSAGGKRVATSVIATGADVIFAMGDDASFGYLQAISTAKAGHKVWYIGDIGDIHADRQRARVALVGAVELREGRRDDHRRRSRHGTFGTAGLQPDARQRRHLAAAQQVHLGERVGADHDGAEGHRERARSRSR